ncbi:uncharacterized protein [Arachis hypogaea]|uniref:uncharacterized protein n=1 Tax=Arachis hypogaea TaxID=3818 RepID=UPI000DED2570|nr:uncharacterized protein LOC112709058 [Arachis hypogaea]
MYEMQNQWNPAEVYNVKMVLQDEWHTKTKYTVFKNLIRKHGFYSMKNFIVKGWGKGIRTCGHKYKLNFYIKTSVSRLTSGTFFFNPFHFVSYEEVQAMPAGNENHLIDYIGHIVGKEDITNMVTKSGRECKLLGIYLEDLQKNRLKCILFDDLVNKVENFLDKADGQPLEGDLCSQGITSIQSQPPQSVSDEINGDSIKSVVEIMNMREESTYWVVDTIVSIEHGVRDWCYASCGFYPRKVQVNKDRYRLNAIITDGTGV